jgi:hypothetical protein
MATIVRKPNMNRVYLTGDVGELRSLLSDFRARHDDFGYWLPLHREAALKAAISEETSYLAKMAAEEAEWENAKSQIPAEYKIRHGSAYGGEVRLGNETISEHGIQTDKLPWTHIATWQKRVRDLTGQSSINGRVMDSATLYGATLGDGRPIFRIATSSGFGDDLRETYYFPPDVWAALMAAEVRGRGITPEAAREWLAKSRGCVGTELYEFAVSTAMIATVNRG